MQLVENPVKCTFETQHDGGRDSQIVTNRVLLGNYAFQLLAEKFQGDLLFPHAAQDGCGQPTASTPSVSTASVSALARILGFIAALEILFSIVVARFPYRRAERLRKTTSSSAPKTINTTKAHDNKMLTMIGSHRKGWT
jgi:hypothetical protein